MCCCFIPGAFRDQVLTLQPAEVMTPVGAWDEDIPDLEFTPLRSEAAKGQLADAPPAEPVKSPRWVAWLAAVMVLLGLIAVYAAMARRNLMQPEMTPTTALEDGESVQHSFYPSGSAYWRDHAWLAAGAMGCGMAILMLLGNPHVWTGAIGGLAAIAVRGFYLASDELKARWDLTETRLLGPQGRAVRLGEIAQNPQAGLGCAGGHPVWRQTPVEISTGSG